MFTSLVLFFILLLKINECNLNTALFQQYLFISFAISLIQMEFINACCLLFIGNTLMFSSTKGIQICIILLYIYLYIRLMKVHLREQYGTKCLQYITS